MCIGRCTLAYGAYVLRYVYRALYSCVCLCIALCVQGAVLLRMLMYCLYSVLHSVVLLLRLPLRLLPSLLAQGSQPPGDALDVPLDDLAVVCVQVAALVQGLIVSLPLPLPRLRIVQHR